jgi:hypothetical protein
MESSWKIIFKNQAFKRTNKKRNMQKYPNLQPIPPKVIDKSVVFSGFLHQLN